MLTDAEIRKSVQELVAGSLPISSMRGLDNENFVPGETQIQYSGPTWTNEEIEGWLIERIATLSNMETQEVDRDRPFADFSMDSSVIITVTQELSRWLDEEISVTIFWELPTIRDLVRGLTAAAT